MDRTSRFFPPSSSTVCRQGLIFAGLLIASVALLGTGAARAAQEDDFGRAHQHFIGRINRETLIVAPGQAPAPVVHNPDASMNPPTPPVHTYHLGLWFNSPNDATANACPGATTPFNGDHTAGVQVLNTSNFPDDRGPLRQLNP